MSNIEYPSETLKLLYERASLRNFSDEEVAEETLSQILEAGTHAASGGNLQPFSIIKIRDKKKMEKLVEPGNQAFIKTAPVNLLFCIDYYRLRRIAEIEKAPFTATSSLAHYWIALEDTVIVAQTVCTAADSLGLGSVYIGTIFTEPETLRSCKQLFELPDEVLPVVLVTMGYPKVKPPIRKKFDMDTLVHDEKYRIPTDEELKEAVERKYDGQKFEVSEHDRRIDTIREVCEKAHDKEFADKVVQEILKNGYISTFQYGFGLHYRADMMPKVNEDLIELIKEYGFDVFS
ncbi:MAG: nitroreductase family protein [Thermotogota bacterium]|nr:nitroreductase family protein [Thermotogota bacterium]